jgi:hypothetical protein
MPRATTSFVLRLDTLTWQVDPVADDPQGGDVQGVTLYAWPVFFRVDGATTSVDVDGKIHGRATVVGLPDTGWTQRLQPGGAIALAPGVGQWSDQVVPIPVATKDGTTDFGGLFGFALLLLQPAALPDEALRAGHATLADSLQQGLDDLIRDLPAGSTDVPQPLIDALENGISSAIERAIRAAMSGLDDVIGLVDQPQEGHTFAYLSQDDLPADDLDQADFEPAEVSTISWPAFVNGPGTTTVDGVITLHGSIARSCRSVGEGVVAPSTSTPKAVAGYTTAEGYQHAIMATGDGNVTELYWFADAPAAQNRLAHFDQGIVGLAGYATADGYQHVIVPTDDGIVTELYWQGGGAVGQDTLAHFTSPIAAIAGWADGVGFQHVLVATADGELTELWWQGGEVGRGSLAHLDGPFVDAAAFWAHGTHHALVASGDTSIVDVTWTGDGAPAVAVVDPFLADGTHVLGLGAYTAGFEDHVFVGLSDGRIRELHGTLGGQLLHTDLGIVAGLRPTLDGYVDPSGAQHVVAAGGDRALHELWWSPAVSVIFTSS